MRLTVGPLSPAVYWRRRAMILGALLTVVLLITYSCSNESGAEDGKKAAKNRASPSPSAQPEPSALTPSATDPTLPPVDPGPGAGSAPAPGTNTGGGGAPGGASPCADDEITVVPEAESPSVRQGVPTKFFIKIKNVSGRTCVRDVGAHMQELYLQQGGGKQWSSDSCEKRTGNDVVTFPPNHEVSYWLTWDGKSTAQGCTNRPWLAKGSYQLHGRLGTKISQPVPVTVTA